MDDLLKIIAATTGIATAIGGAIGYFIKRNFEMVMERKLKEQNMIFEKEMSAFNAQLENRSKEQFLVFQSLHQERAELIRNLFKSLISVQRSFEGLIRAEMGNNDPKAQFPAVDEQTLQTWMKEYQEKIITMMTTHEENRYYLTESLSGKFEEFVKQLALINSKHYELNMAANQYQPQDYHDKLDELWRLSEGLFGPIIKEIENEFRVIIGVEKEEKVL
jgi:hypothetical protein